jgi:protein-S-isoprenylcysteine O-methyltransferase Ste14
MTSQDHPEVLMPPPLLHLGGLFIGYTLDQVFHWRLAPSDERVMLALLPALPAVALILWTALLFRRHRTTILPQRAASTLVTQGPFRFSRNPIYLSFALLHLACAIANGSPGMLLTLPLVVVVMDRHVIAAEEAFHQRQFGAAWQAYRARVRRWL